MDFLDPPQILMTFLLTTLSSLYLYLNMCTIFIPSLSMNLLQANEYN